MPEAEKFEESSGTFSTEDGLKLSYREYLSPEPRAGLVIAHGLGDHGGRYWNIRDRLLPKGYSIWALDHRGHGRSEGGRGHVMRFGQYIDDLNLTVSHARKKSAQGQRLFLFGHSMGGLISIMYALEHPEAVDGVIVSSPALGMVVKVPALKRLLGRIMSSLKPDLSLDSGLNKERISHDPQAVKSYLEDPLVHLKVSARWFTEFTGAIDDTQNRAAELKPPLLFLVAGDDYMVNSQSAREFYRKLSCPDKTMKFYDGMYHRIFDEKSEWRETVLNDLESWLDERTG